MEREVGGRTGSKANASCTQCKKGGGGDKRERCEGRVTGSTANTSCTDCRTLSH